MIDATKYFFWWISGGDIRYIEKAAAKSQRHFLLIGISCFVILSMMVISFTNAFHELFELGWVSIMPSIILTGILCSIYWLNIISMEPHTLPYKKEKGSVWSSIIVRVFVITLFAFFVSKLFEVYLFGGLVDDQVFLAQLEAENSLPFGVHVQGSFFETRLELLNYHYPAVWVITLFTIGLFLFPIRKKFQLRRHQEYFNLKRITEKSLVESEFEKFISEYNLIFSRLDEKLKTENLEIIRYKYRKFNDPPFNTVPIPQNESLSHEDFLKELS